MPGDEQANENKRSLARSAQVVQKDPGRLSIYGDVDYHTVPALLKQAGKFINNADQLAGGHMGTDVVTVDMAKTARCNSAALALMLELAGLGTARGLKLQFVNIPESLLTIANVYGVESGIRDFLR